MNIHQDQIEKIKFYLDKVSTMVGFDFEALTDESVTSRSINLGTIDAERELIHAYKRYNESQFELALFHLDKSIDKTVASISLRKCLTSVEDIEETLEFISIFKQIKHSAFVGQLNELNKNVAERYYDESQFSITLEELGKKIDLSMMSSLIEELMSGNLIKTYLISGTHKLRVDSRIQWLKNIVVTEDVSSTLEALQSKQNTVDDDLHQIIPMLAYNTKIELYSYFCIAIVSKEGVVLLSDNEEFANPHAATTTRNPYRRREDAIERLYFPYDILLDNKLGKLNKLPATNSNSFATWQFPLKDIFWDSMLFMKMLVNAYVSMSNNDTIAEIKTVKTFSQHLNTLSLPPNKSMTDKDSFYNKKNEKYEGAGKYISDYEEFMETNKKSSSLVVADKSIIIKQKAYDPNALVTSDQALNLIEYYGREQKREQIQKELDKFDENVPGTRSMSRYSVDMKNWLCKAFREDLDRLIAVAYSGNEVYFENSEEMSNVNKFGYMSNEGKTILTLLSREGDKSYCTELINEDPYYCLVDGDEHARTATRYRKVQISNYENIMSLLQIERKEIPKSMMNYRGRDFIPYVGNTMLSDVDPLQRIYDRFSRRYENGFYLGMKLCGYADNRLKRKHFIAEQTVYKLDGTVVSIDEYRKTKETSIRGGFWINKF